MCKKAHYSFKMSKKIYQVTGNIVFNWQPFKFCGGMLSNSASNN